MIIIIIIIIINGSNKVRIINYLKKTELGCWHSLVY